MKYKTRAKISNAISYLILFAVVLGALLGVVAIFAAVLKAVEPTWQATAYCKGQVVAAGLPVRRGMVASDPRVLPLGSVVRIGGTGHENFDGVYTVLDTGPAIQGRLLDLYMWSCYEALDFGRREIEVEVLRRGWDPNGKGLR